jgi:hypothetical protein
MRWVAFMLEGQHGPTFLGVFGSAVTTMVTMVLLVVVSFSMAALSSEQHHTSSPERPDSSLGRQSRRC